MTEFIAKLLDYFLQVIKETSINQGLSLKERKNSLIK